VSAFPEDEPDTGKIDARIVLFAKLAHAFDHLPPSDQMRFVELADRIVDMAPACRVLVFEIVQRLK
jgi:hypothetical protein